MQIIDYKIEKHENDECKQNCVASIVFTLDGNTQYTDRFSFEDLENLTVGLQDILLELFIECRKK